MSNALTHAMAIANSHIERLQELNSSLVSQRIENEEEIKRLRAENERLRAALKPFAYYADAHRVVPSDFVITQGWIIAKRPLMMGDCYEACRVLGGV